MFSFEFFPPKTDEARRTLETLEVLEDDRPDDVYLTYAAGGTTGAGEGRANGWRNPRWLGRKLAPCDLLLALPRLRELRPDFF